jgi:alkaline phosphatase D
MRYLQLLLIIALCFAGSAAFAQHHAGTARLSVDADLAPFYHGVASGDPLSDRVILWTRITTQTPGTQTVEWKVATDTAFSNVVSQGTAYTDETKDYTVKVDATGLQPYTYYYYQFETGGIKSMIGRTKTAPSTSPGHLRFGVVSCSDYQQGYFNAYESLMLRNDIDAVVHLGDYIYEYNNDASLDRQIQPANETVTLEDYDARYNHYRLDPQLMKLHQQYPFIAVWDDHESADNAWIGGASNHDSTEGDWNIRKRNSADAFFNWMPIREQASPNERRIYRTFDYGNLAELIFLESRIEGRVEPSGDPADLVDTSRTMLGAAQYNWLIDELHNSTAKWKVIAQQTMMAPLKVAGTVLNFDQWDGYPVERAKLYNTILTDSIKNVVVLSGDIHMAIANNLLYGPTEIPVAVEFVSTSVTAPGFPVGVGDAVLLTSNDPHMQYVDINAHGYSILDLTDTHAQSDFYSVNIDVQDATADPKASWYAMENAPFLQEGTEAPGLANVAPFAPIPGSLSGIKSTQETDVVLLGSYPNPFENEIMVQYYVPSGKPVTAKVYDMSGKQVYSKALGNQKGVNYSKLYLDNMQAGTYILMLDNGTSTFRKTITKVR